MKQGNFTLPGEAGYEKLTLDLAKKWGADVIRDSDGTKLSQDILDAGYQIYSTVCVIRDHNEWAKQHPDCQQESFLMAGPVAAEGAELEIRLLDQFYTEQFQINESADSVKYWQVFDRTSETEVPAGQWDYADGMVTIHGCTPWHEYTVNFLAYRIWEEISMYNYVTNSWTGEHLMQIDPRYPETQEYMLGWMDRWCKEHPQTDVVRFTSLFYNFVWIWGSDARCRNLFTDWASYDFTVSPLALDQFEQEYGYRMTSEDFINQGKLHVTHMPPTRHKKDWMEFIHRFVVSFGRKLIDIVHQYGKKAYVFYDDSWVGLEPYSEDFGEFGFDGLIKCVFSGYEVRLCANVPGVTHELRLHPYLFPVGLGGAPTFMEGGQPALDAQRYWIHIRRALLQQCTDRIGLGGYLHLTLGFEEFNDRIEQIADEFRTIQELHAEGEPERLPVHVAVLHAWGKIRSWSLSGHFHETYMHTLIHVNEALAGLPVEVSFINLDDVKNQDLSRYQVIINAGREGDAWSGGDGWKDPEVVSRLLSWTAAGGTFIGINEPSAVEGTTHRFRMAPALGVDLDRGEKVCHGKFTFTSEETDLPEDCTFPAKTGLYLTDPDTRVLRAVDGTPVYTEHRFGKGRGVYLSDYSWTPASLRVLYQILTPEGCELPISDNPEVETVWFPASRTVVFLNNSEKNQHAEAVVDGKTVTADLAPLADQYIRI